MACNHKAPSTCAPAQSGQSFTLNLHRGRQWGELLERRESEVLEEIRRRGQEGWTADRLAPPHFRDEPASKQGVHRAVAVHTTYRLYISTRGRLTIGDDREGLERGPGETHWRRRTQVPLHGGRGARRRHELKLTVALLKRQAKRWVMFEKLADLLNPFRGHLQYPGNVVLCKRARCREKHGDEVTGQLPIPEQVTVRRGTRRPVNVCAMRGVSAIKCRHERGL